MAALAAPAQPLGTPSGRSLSPGRNASPNWNEDDLADDVATLSYESALKAHARYRCADQSLTQLPDPTPFCFEEAAPAASAAGPQPASHLAANSKPVAAPEPETSRLRTASLERNLKDASITIRMSREECAQLHRRAAEAGLTVSAYLRSCTFEAESLRTMVKDTLAQLRAVTAQAKPDTPVSPRRFRLGKQAGWLARLFTPWHGSQRTASA
jgi:hypothetical protein